MLGRSDEQGSTVCHNYAPIHSSTATAAAATSNIRLTALKPIFRPMETSIGRKALTLHKGCTISTNATTLHSFVLFALQQLIADP